MYFLSMFTVGHTSLFHLNQMNLLSVDVDQLLQIFQGWMKTILSVKIDAVAVQQPSCRVGGWVMVIQYAH